MNLFEKELMDKKTNYFIIDSSSSAEHNDVDFKYYSYQNRNNNQLHKNDLIIYRRSGSGSEWGNEFYLYGAGKFGDVIAKDPQSGNDIVAIEQPYLFSHRLMKQNLRTFDWKFRKFKGKWSNFFNMNGITKITKDDFVGLLSRQLDMSKETSNLSLAEESIAVKCYQAERKEAYFIGDEVKGTPSRRAVDKFFTDKVKFIYHYKSALTGDTDEDNLVAVRIVPWEDDPKIRLDPRNGICLTKKLAKAFVQGYFTLTDDGRITLSNLASAEPIINKTLNKYKNRKIYMNKQYSPNKKYLNYHREHIFKR
ncbi:HNH endonuclease [Companilactobacillus halodurans]|uniref:HNH endonuclease n=1 Tax=Companilactobacillus halodurans TaxID=2584183 RepID=A0A5P0ZX62_9LACO|nr:HNH endonuclease signature motif containing protein [Companilactobacillus halodurans]MQS76247.1 HNH endonuclease [Companilactobacillus halodurans]MQS97388.1 HNH endonuclease [Companilactobacillus halodurans]